MKTLTRLIPILALLAFPAHAQNTPTQTSTGNITAQGATCNTTNACISMILPNNANTVAVVLDGTFVAELILEQSADNGLTWVTVATLSAPGTTSYSVLAMTNFRVRCDGFTSGKVVVTLNESTGGGSGGGGGGGNVSGSGTANNVTCWAGTSIITNCPDFLDISGAPQIIGPLTITGGAGFTSSIGLPEGAPANCLSPAAGKQILCSINSPDSLVLSSNGGAYAAIGSGGGGSTWATLPLSGTNTGTGLVHAPTATGTVPYTLDCPTGMTVDCFDLKVNHIKQFWLDSSGNMNFAGSQLDIASSTSTVAGLFAIHGIQTVSGPGGCVDLLNDADAITTFLCAGATSGQYMLSAGLPVSDTVQFYALASPTVTPKTANYTVFCQLDFNRLINYTTGGSTLTIPQSGGGTSLTDAAHCGPGWLLHVSNSSAVAETIASTTSNFYGSGLTPGTSFSLAAGQNADIDADTAFNYHVVMGSSSGGSGTVTHTAGALTANQLVFGNGSADIAVGDLTGDITTSGGKATTLATTGASAASCGDSTHTCALTINTKGQVTANSNTAVGLGGRAVTGAATTDSIVSGDNATVIDHDQAASGTVNQTLPTATTLGNASFVYSYANHSAQTDTITPTTWTIQKGSAAAGSSISIPSGGFVRITVDPNSSTNWLADCAGCGTTGLSGMTATQVPIAATATTVTSSKALVGTDTGIATAATISTTAGTAVCSTANGGVSTTGCAAASMLTAAGSKWVVMNPFAGFIGGSAGAGQGIAVTNGTANQGNYFQWVLPVPAKITKMTFDVITLGASSHVDFGIYSISGTTGTLVAHTGSQSGVATGIQTITLGSPVTLNPGTYFLGECSDNTTVRIQIVGASDSAMGGMLSSAAAPNTWGGDATDTCTAGVLPGTITTTNITNALQYPVFILATN